MDLPEINMNSIEHAVRNAAKNTGNLIAEHKTESMIAALLVATACDNVRVRISRKRERKTFEKTAIKQQDVARKHEMEIRDLKIESEQAKEATKKIAQLEQIVKNMACGGASE